MSLNFEFTDKTRFAAFTEADKKENESFIFGCMIVRLGAITEANAEEWHRRYVFANRVNGPFYTVWDDARENRVPWVPTLEDVRKRIGLRTNVTTETTAKFLKAVYAVYEQDLDATIRRAARSGVPS